jgi:hypothetical protein
MHSNLSTREIELINKRLNCQAKSKMAASSLLLIVEMATALSLQNFINLHFHDDSVVVVSSNFENWHPKLQPLLHLHNPKIAANPRVPHSLRAYKNYIIVEDDPDALTASVDRLLYNFDPRGRILVIFHENSTEDDLKSTFKTLWSYYVHNVVVWANWTRFVTWYPYGVDNRCGTVVNLVTNLSPFADKIPQDMHGCPVKVTWNKFSYAVRSPFDRRNPGYAIKFLDTIAQQMNIEMQYLRNNSDYFLENMRNGSYHYLVHDVTVRRIDVGVAYASLTHRLDRQVETTRPFFQTNQFFVFPPRKKLKANRNILGIFTAAIWTAILFSITAMIVFWKHLTREPLPWSVFFVVRLTFQSIGNPPKSALLRVVFLLFVVYMTALNWIYLSQLSSILTSPQYEPQIRKMEDLLVSDKKLKFKTVHVQFLAAFGNTTYRNLIGRRLEDDDRMDHFGLIRDFVDKRDHGIVMGETDLAWIKNNKKLEVLVHDKVRVQKFSLGHWLHFDVLSILILLPD